MAVHESIGWTYKDMITGFSGVAVSRTEYLTGCIHLGLESGDKDNKSITEYFDENRLERMDDVRIVYTRPGDTVSPGGTPTPQHNHP